MAREMLDTNSPLPYSYTKVNGGFSTRFGSKTPPTLSLGDCCIEMYLFMFEILSLIDEKSWDPYL